MGERDEAQPWIAGFGENLRRARKLSGLSQEQLAVRADISPVTLSKLENGRSIPTLQAFVRLAHALSTTPNDLLAWKEPTKQADQDIAAIIGGLDGLSTEWRKALVRIVTLAAGKRR